MPSRGEVQARREAAARRHQAEARIRIAIREALEAGVPTENIALAVAEALRESGLLATADEVIANGRKTLRKK